MAASTAFPAMPVDAEGSLLDRARQADLVELPGRDQSLVFTSMVSWRDRRVFAEWRFAPMTAETDERSRACPSAPPRRFFFSSRRRHTRLTCDWSSDVCSSD